MAEIVRTFEELEKIVKSNYENPDLETLKRAFDMANEAHSGEMRLTGHPFITHPVSVAFRLADMGLHLNVVVAGLLHGGQHIAPYCAPPALSQSLPVAGSGTAAGVAPVFDVAATTATAIALASPVGVTR